MYFFVYAYLYNTSAHLYFKYSSLLGYYYSLGSNERESLLLNLKCILLIYKRDSLNDPVINSIRSDPNIWPKLSH